MKVDAIEVEKINSALNSIEGWSVDRFDFWESAKGKLMATIRLKRNEDIGGATLIGTTLIKED